MKHLFSSFLTLVMLLALSAPAYADVMWEPNGNYFYDTHRDQCEYENRGYYANGKEGFITLWDAPNGGTVRAQFQNGERMWVYYIYRDRWALTAYWTDGEETSGWVPLADLSLIYDFISFEEEYADQIRPYNGEFADYAGGAAEVNFYSYPGSKGISMTWETGGSWHVLDNLTGTLENDSYMYGRLNAWFCLDEPDGTDFPVREVSTAELIPAQTPVLPVKGYTPYILVAAVMAVTGGLLFFFYGKRRKTTK